MLMKLSHVLEKDLEDNLEMYNINVRTLGEEYRNKTFTGRTIFKKRTSLL